VRRQDEVGPAQCHGFLGAQPGVIQAAEERGQLRTETSHLGQDRPHLGAAGDGLRVHPGSAELPKDQESSSCPCGYDFCRKYSMILLACSWLTSTSSGPRSPRSHSTIAEYVSS